MYYILVCLSKVFQRTIFSFVLPFQRESVCKGKAFFRNLQIRDRKKFGKGFSRANIWNMITFYKEYGSVQTVSERLSWSHYCELLSISDKAKRHFYEIECANSRWSVRELRRQIASSLFERLLLSDGKANKQKVLELSLKGNEIVKPQDIVK